MRGIRDAHLNLALLQYLFATYQPSTFYDEHKTLAAFASHRAARDHQHIRALLGIDAHTHVHVGQKFQPVVIHRTQEFADAARAARHHLFRDHFRFALPGAQRQSIPGDAHRFIAAERADFRFVHKSAHANFVQVGHLRQQVASFYKIALAHGKRIQRAISRRADAAIGNFFFESVDFALRLLHLQAAAGGVQMNAAGKLVSGGGEPRDFGLRFGEFQFVASQLIFGRGLLRQKPLQRVVTALQAVAFGDSFGEVAGNPRGVIGAAAGIGGAKIVPRFQQAPARLRQQRRRVLYIQLQEQLAFFHLLAFVRGDLLDKCIKLGAHDKRRDGLDFAVTADGGNDVFSRGQHCRKLGHRLTSAQQDQHVRQNARGQEKEQETIAESAIHDPRVCAAAAGGRFTQ